MLFECNTRKKVHKMKEKSIKTSKCLRTFFSKISFDFFSVDRALRMRRERKNAARQVLFKRFQKRNEKFQT